jgi:precorrin-6Y C5,15-methyltransferase (decarboxylating)
VGIGDDGLAGLSPAARALVDEAEVLVGGARHLAMLADDRREHLQWPCPFDPLVPELEQRRGRRVCVLATGDPSFFGVAPLLGRHFEADEMRVVPAPSAFSLACARLGWSALDVDTVSLHGRPLETLHPFVQPGARVLILSRDGDTPARVASLLRERGYAGSRLTVFEHMGSGKEKRITHTAASWPAQRPADLNTIALQCVAGEEAVTLPCAAGLPDDAYEHDGQLTKREVRALTLASLAPGPGQTLWDIGAGCGSVAIEWLRVARRARAIAVEKTASRCELIRRNANALGVPSVEVIEAVAPAPLAGLATPDAVFVGGGIVAPGVMDGCWSALPAGGRLVANAVSVEAERVLADWQQKVDGTLVRLSVSRLSPVGRFHAWRPMMPVTHFAATKHGAAS